MTFITARKAINAAAGIAEGIKARNAMKDAAGQERAEPDFKTFKEAFAALCTVRNQLNDYYKAHPLLGRIVKWFDTHAIGGHFGKKSKIDALVKELQIFQGREEQAQKKAAEAARKAEDERLAAEAARKAEEERKQRAAAKKPAPQKRDEDADLKKAMEASLRDQKPKAPGMDPRLANRLAEQASKVTYAEEQEKRNG